MNLDRIKEAVEANVTMKPKEVTKENFNDWMKSMSAPISIKRIHKQYIECFNGEALGGTIVWNESEG